MVITGVNLRELIEQYDVVPLCCFDMFSLTLHLNSNITKYNMPADHVVTYGEEIKNAHITRETISSEYILNPGQAILASSCERVKMPAGYMGFLQTKGSLARLFVTVHCCDGQIEPGFEGRVTFEICNIGQMRVRLLPESPIAQLFILKTSSDKDLYDGKYNNSDKPTYSMK